MCDESEDLEDDQYIALIPVTKQITCKSTASTLSSSATPPTKKQRCTTKQEFEDHTIHQLTELMIEGTPLTLQAVVGMVQAWVAKKLVNVTFYKFLRCPFLLWDLDSTRTRTFKKPFIITLNDYISHPI